MPESAVSGNSAPGISDHQWDEIFDVVVVGSGGGALTSALLAARGGASTVVVEKDEFIGGTTAVSGGDMWIPNNRFVKDRDSREDAIAYITRLSDGRASDPALIEVYVDTAPEMFEYLLETTGYDSEPHITLDDYYSVIGDRIPGVRHFPRTCAVKPYPAGAELGLELARKINRARGSRRPRSASPSSGAARSAPRSWPGAQREVWRAKGGGLIAPLLKGLVDGGVEVRTSTPRSSWSPTTRGAVVGVVVERPGRHAPDRRPPRRRPGLRRLRVERRDGQDVHRVRGQARDAVVEHRRRAPDGDGGRRQAGRDDGPSSATASSTSLWEKGRDGNPLPQMIMGLGPGSIIVNQHGKRFMHGGYTYNDFSAPFGFFDQRNPGFTEQAPGVEHLRRRASRAGHHRAPSRASR